MFNLDKIKDLPVLDIGIREGQTQYIDFIQLRELIYPAMQGLDINNRHFLVIKVDIDGETVFQTFFQRYEHNNNLWVGGGFYNCFMGFPGGLTQDQFQLIYDILDKKNPIIEDIHRPTKTSYIGKTIKLVD